MPIFFTFPARAVPDPPGLILSMAQAAVQRSAARNLCDCIIVVSRSGGGNAC